MYKAIKNKDDNGFDYLFTGSPTDLPKSAKFGELAYAFEGEYRGSIFMFNDETKEWVEQPEGSIGNLEQALAEAREAAAVAMDAAERSEDVLNSIPEDYTELESSVSELKQDLESLNAINYLNLTNPTPSSFRGVTFSKNADGSVTVSGTATAETFYNYLVSTNSLPEWIKPGEKYRLLYTSTNVQFNFWFYKNGSYLSGVSTYTDREIVIPADATGVMFRMRVFSGTSVNETVKPVIINTMTNKELSDALAGLSNSLAYKGAVENSTNLNDVQESGIYLLTGNDSAPTPHGTLFVIKASSTITVQIIFQFKDLNIYYRKKLSSAWDEWQDTNYRNGVKFPQYSTEYIAFGDSLTWGALWRNATPTVVRASEGTRIPDRIANACNCKSYVNYGVGGMGFVVKTLANPDTILDEMKKHDITNASLITVMGGRNDGTAQLGSRTSVIGDGTICGAIKELIEYVETQNRSCQLVIIQVTPYTSVNKPWTAMSTAGWTLNDFDAEVSEICKESNVGYVNWRGCSLFNHWSDLSGGGGNYAHMTYEKDYVQMGNFIGGKVSALFKN